MLVFVACAFLAANAKKVPFLADNNLVISGSLTTWASDCQFTTTQQTAPPFSVPSEPVSVSTGLHWIITLGILEIGRAHV